MAGRRKQGVAASELPLLSLARLTIASSMSASSRNSSFERGRSASDPGSASAVKESSINFRSSPKLISCNLAK